MTETKNEATTSSRSGGGGGGDGADCGNKQRRIPNKNLAVMRVLLQPKLIWTVNLILVLILRNVSRSTNTVSHVSDMMKANTMNVSRFRDDEHERTTNTNTTRNTTRNTTNTNTTGVVMEARSRSRSRSRASPPRIAVVVAYCREDLSWMDGFGGCEGIHFLIYSKCGFSREIFHFVHIAECVAIYRIPNCGLQEFAYFQYVIDHYPNSHLDDVDDDQDHQDDQDRHHDDDDDHQQINSNNQTPTDDHDHGHRSRRYEYSGTSIDTIAPLTAFVQGGSLTENPHIVNDILSTLPGTTFKDLSRHVRTVWHFQHSVNDTVVHDIYRKMGTEDVLDHESWLIGWRSMFMASRSALTRIPRSSYVEFNDHSCHKRCRYINCNTEATWGPIYRCVPYLFRGETCAPPKHFHGLAPTTWEQDFQKDSKLDGTAANDTYVVTCGNRSIVYALSTINGLLTCVDHHDDDDDGRPNGKNAITPIDWEMALKRSFHETFTGINFTGAQWGQPSQWTKHDEFRKRGQNEVLEVKGGHRKKA